MTYGLTRWICLTGTIALCAGAYAVVKEAPAPSPQEEGAALDVDLEERRSAPPRNPYQSIVDRNVFGLRPIPPPPVQNVEPPKPPPTDIFLTGITTILGNKRALLKTPPPPAKPNEPRPTEQFYMLTEGQRDGDMEVLEIDEKAGVVKVNFAGNIRSLNFEENGVKMNTAAPMPGIPAGVPPTALGRPAPGVPVQGGGVPGATTMPMPMRTLRMPSGTPGAAPNASYSSPNVSPNAQFGTSQGNLTVGGYSRSSPNTQAAPNQAFQQQVPVETQFIMIEAERERTRKAVEAGRLPPLPPTPLTSPGAAGLAQPAPAQDLTLPTRRPLPPRMPGMPQLPQ